MPDLLGLVDTLARLQLAAKRTGRAVSGIYGAPAGLHELVSFLGLDGVLGVDAGGQPVEREQRIGVEEERALDDPPA